ncbi:MAG: lectin-like domain-containing protein, partial [Candidatus Kapaibacteriota bacterium]
QTKTQYSMENFALCRSWWYYDGEERTSARFTGAIDEVKIFLRALSDEEISLECQSCGPMSFAYDKFSPTPSLRLINNARLLDSTIRLSPSSPNQVGALWTSHLVPVARGFETSFKFRLSDGFNQMQSEQHFPGADGIAFVIQNHSPFAIGNIGGGIGYDGIPNSLAIEFDTYSNDSSQIENFGDPNDNHIAVLCNGINPNSSKHFPPYIRGQTTQIPPIRTDGTIYYAKITYDNVNQRLSIWLDTVENYTTPKLVVEGIDISSELNLDGGEGAYIGFTSATGNAYENHDLLAWSFCANSNTIYSSIINEQSEKNDNITNSFLKNKNELISFLNEISLREKVENCTFINLLGQKIFEVELSQNNDFILLNKLLKENSDVYKFLVKKIGKSLLLLIF